MIEIDRIDRAMERPRFAEKVFTQAEREMLSARKPSSWAGNFAAKEAVAKALGTGFDGFGPLDIEILRDERGKPFARLYNEAAAKAGGGAAHVSISDCGAYAAAFAVIES